MPVQDMMNTLIEDMESITFHESEDKEITQQFDTKLDYEGVLE